MPANPNCPACKGHGQWYSPDNGQIVTCDCDMMKHVSRVEIQRTDSKLDKLERFVQLHQKVEIYYVVDGYIANYLTQDGDHIEREVKGATILEALQELEESLRENPPKTGGPRCA